MSPENLKKLDEANSSINAIKSMGSILKAAGIGDQQVDMNMFTETTVIILEILLTVGVSITNLEERLDMIEKRITECEGHQMAIKPGAAEPFEEW